jgi:hypothetical protein
MDDLLYTREELRERIDDYRRLSRPTMDKQFLCAIDAIIAETQEELWRLEDGMGGRGLT